MKKTGTLGEINEARHTSFWDNFGGMKFVIVLVLIAAIGGIAISAMNHNSVASTSANPNSFSGDGPANNFPVAGNDDKDDKDIENKIEKGSAQTKLPYFKNGAKNNPSRTLSLVSASMQNKRDYSFTIRNDGKMRQGSTIGLDIEFEGIYNGNAQGSLEAQILEDFNLEPGKAKTFKGSINKYNCFGIEPEVFTGMRIKRIIVL